MDDKRLGRIEDKIDQLHTTLTEVKMGYEEHERRSLANEKAVEVLKAEIKPVIVYLEVAKIIGKVFVWACGSALVWKLLDFIRRLV